MEVQLQLQKLHDQTDQITGDYQQSKTVFENLDKHSKTILAQTELDYTGSQAAIARNALADPRYIEHLENVKEARGAYNRSWALLRGLEIKLSCLQSINRHLSNI